MFSHRFSLGVFQKIGNKFGEWLFFLNKGRNTRVPLIERSGDVAMRGLDFELYLSFVLGRRKGKEVAVLGKVVKQGQTLGNQDDEQECDKFAACGWWLLFGLLVEESHHGGKLAGVLLLVCH